MPPSRAASRRSLSEPGGVIFPFLHYRLFVFFVEDIFHTISVRAGLYRSA
jgi:hypothetical protein